MATKKIDLPELLSRLQVLDFNIQTLEKDLKEQITAVQNLFSTLDEKGNYPKLNEVLTRLEFFVNVLLAGKIDFFKTVSKRIKKIGNLN